MRNQISLRMLLLLLTVAALIAALYRVADQSRWLVSLLVMIELILFTFGFYGLMFCLAYPLGRLNKYFLDRSDLGQSPFATDRLPQQIIKPTQNEAE